MANRPTNGNYINHIISKAGMPTTPEYKDALTEKLCTDEGRQDLYNRLTAKGKIKVPYERFCENLDNDFATDSAYMASLYQGRVSKGMEDNAENRNKFMSSIYNEKSCEKRHKELTEAGVIDCDYTTFKNNLAGVKPTEASPAEQETEPAPAKPAATRRDYLPQAVRGYSLPEEALDTNEPAKQEETQPEQPAEEKAEETAELTDWQKQFYARHNITPEGLTRSLQFQPFKAQQIKLSFFNPQAAMLDAVSPHGQAAYARAQKERNAAIDNAIASAWQQAEKQYEADRKKHDEQAVKTNLNPSIGLGGREGHAMLSGERAVTKKEDRFRNFDMERLLDNAWSALGEDKAMDITSDWYSYLKQENPDKNEDELRNMAVEYAKAEVAQRLSDYAIQQNMPANNVEFFMRKIADMNTLGQIANGIARMGAGSTGDLYHSIQANEIYKKGGHGRTWLSFGGTVLGVALDPITYLSMGGGGLAAKGVTMLGGRILAGMGERAVVNAGTRLFATQVGKQVLTSSVKGAVNFGIYQGLHEGIGQFQSGEFNPGAILGSTAEGMALGAVTGGFAGTTAPLFNRVVKATKSTAGKVGLRVGEFNLGAIFDGTVFYAPDFIRGDRDAGNWLESVGQMYAFRGKEVARLPFAMADTYRVGKITRQGFETSLRQRLDRLGNMAYTKDIQNELRDKGYTDILDFIKPRDTRVMDEAGVEVGEVVEDGRLQSFMGDRTISEEARAYVYYVLEGKMLRPSTMTRVDMIEDANGYLVVTSGADGAAITKHRYTTKAGAEAEVQDAMRQVELNYINVGEKFYTEANKQAKLYVALELALNGNKDYVDAQRYAYEHDLTGDKLKSLVEQYREDPNSIADRELRSVIADVVKIYEDRQTLQGDRLAELREKLNTKYSCDIDDIIRKEPKRRSNEEQQALDEYITELYRYADKGTEESGQRRLTDQAGEGIEPEQPQAETDEVETYREELTVAEDEPGSGTIMLAPDKSGDMYAVKQNPNDPTSVIAYPLADGEDGKVAFGKPAVKSSSDIDFNAGKAVAIEDLTQELASRRETEAQQKAAAEETARKTPQITNETGFLVPNETALRGFTDSNKQKPKTVAFGKGGRIVVSSNYEMTDDPDALVPCIIYKNGQSKMGSSLNIPLGELQVYARGAAERGEPVTKAGLEALNTPAEQPAEQEPAPAEPSMPVADEAGEPVAVSQNESGIPIDSENNPIYEGQPADMVLSDLYNNQGLTAEEAEGFIAAKIGEAQGVLAELQKNAPKMGTNIAQYKQAKAEYEAAVANAQQSLDYWNGVAAYQKPDEAYQKPDEAYQEPTETNQNPQNNGTEPEQPRANTEVIASQAEAVADQIATQLQEAADEQALNDLEQVIDAQIEAVNEQLALLGYYEADQDEKLYHESYGYMLSAEKKAVQDAHNLGVKLAKDLGLTIPKGNVTKKKWQFGSPIARANIAPAGGDVTITLPISEGKELKIYLDLAPTGVQENGFYTDDLQLNGIMFRVHENNRSLDNWFVNTDATYTELLREIKLKVGSYLGERMPAEPKESPVKVVDLMGVIGDLNQKGEAKLSDHATPLAQAIAEEEAKVETNPTEAQKEAKYKEMDEAAGEVEDITLSEEAQEEDGESREEAPFEFAGEALKKMVFEERVASGKTVIDVSDIELPANEYSVLYSNIFSKHANKNVKGTWGNTYDYEYLCDYEDNTVKPQFCIKIEGNENIIRALKTLGNDELNRIAEDLSGRLVSLRDGRGRPDRNNVGFEGQRGSAVPNVGVGSGKSREQRNSELQGSVHEGNRLGENFEIGKEYGVEVLKSLFDRFNTDPENAELFDALYKIAKDTGLRIKFEEGNFGGKPAYYRNDNSITIRLGFLNGQSPEKAHVFLHELIHPMTMYAIRGVERGKITDPALVSAVNDLKALFEQCREEGMLPGSYGMTNPIEFVAEYSNPEFREELKRRNLWQRFVDAVKRIFNSLFGREGKDLGSIFERFLNNFDRTAYNKYNGVKEKRADDDEWAFYEDVQTRSEALCNNMGVGVQFRDTRQNRITFNDRLNLVTVPNQYTNAERAERDIVFEVAARRGMEGIIGSSAINDLLGKLQDIVTRYMPNSTQPLDEELKSIVDFGTNDIVWTKIERAVRTAMKNKGIEPKLNKNDIAALIYADIISRTNFSMGAERQVMLDKLEELRDLADLQREAEAAANASPAERIWTEILSIKEPGEKSKWYAELADFAVRFYTNVNSDFRLKLLNDYLKKTLGAKYTEDTDLFVRHTLIRGKVRHQLNLFKREKYEPLKKAMQAIRKAANCNLYDLDCYLMAKHMPERSDWFFSKDVTTDMLRLEDGVMETLAALLGIDAEFSEKELEAIAVKTINELYDKKEYNTREHATRVVQEAYDYLTQAYEPQDPYYLQSSEFDALVDSFVDNVDDVADKRREDLGDDYSGITGFSKPKEQGGVGMTPAEYVTKFEAKLGRNANRLLTNLWRAVKEVAQFTMDNAVETGFMTPEEREATLARGWKHYVPLRSWNEKNDMGDFFIDIEYPENEDTDGYLRKPPVAKGRTTMPNSPSEYLLYNAVSSINSKEFNEYYKAAGHLCENNRDLDYIFGRPDWMIENPRERAKHEVPYYEDGTLKKAVFVNPQIAAIILDKDRKQAQQGGYFKNAVAKTTRSMSAAVTQYRPRFAMNNFVRDLLYSVFKANVDGKVWNPVRGAKMLWHVVKMLPVAVAATSDKYTFEGRSKGAKILRSFLESGGETGWYTLNNREETKRQLYKDIKDGNFKRFLKRAWDIMKEVLRFASEVSERCVRLGAFDYAKAKGMSNQMAANYAKESSTNFDRRGRWSNRHGFWYSFFNAKLQGLDNALSLMAKHPVNAMIQFAVDFALGLANAMIMGALTNGDEDDDYNNRSSYIRMNNIVWYSLALPFAHFHVMFFGMGAAYGHYLNGRSDKKEMATDMIHVAGQEMLPGPLDLTENIEYDPKERNIKLSSNWFHHNLLPSPFVPIADIALNRDFMGRPINTEPYTKKQEDYMPWVARSRKPNPYLEQLAVKVAMLSGYNPELDGNISVKKDGVSQYKGSPMSSASTWEHLLNGYFGGFSELPNNFSRIANKMATGEELDKKDWQFINAFYRPIDKESAIRRKFYMLKYYADYVEELKDEMERKIKDPAISMEARIEAKDRYIHLNQLQARTIMPKFQKFEALVDKLYKEGKKTYGKDEGRIEEIRLQLMEQANEFERDLLKEIDPERLKRMEQEEMRGQFFGSYINQE